MLEVGRICMKIAGRDAGKLGVIVEVLDENFVLLDGEVRRRKISIKHLEPINKTVDISKGASHADVLKALGLKEGKKKSDKKEKGPRPTRVRKSKVSDKPKKVKKTKTEEKPKAKKEVKTK